MSLVKSLSRAGSCRCPSRLTAVDRPPNHLRHQRGKKDGAVGTALAMVEAPAALPRRFPRRPAPPIAPLNRATTPLICVVNVQIDRTPH